MASYYSGQDYSGLVIAPYVPGYGHWDADIQIAEDGDNRDAATANMVAEGALDRTVWIAWRMVDGRGGGTYGAAITWNGAQTWTATESHAGTETHSGAVSFTNAAPVVFVNSLTCSAGTTTLVALQVNGAANIAGGLALPSGSVAQVADKIIHTGANAWRSLRVTAGSTSSVTVNPWEFDLCVVPTLAVPRIYTLAHPPNNEIVESTFYFAGSGALITLSLSDGGPVIATLVTGGLKTVTVIYTGTAWIVKSAVT